MPAVKPYKLGADIGGGVSNNLIEWAADEFLAMVHGGLGASFANPTALINDAAWLLETRANKNIANGYPGLNASSQILAAQAAANTVFTTAANVYTAGAKQSFQHGAVLAGARFIPVAGDPSTLSDGDFWYDSATGFKYRQGGATLLLSSGGGGTTNPGGSTTHIQFNNAGAFGGTAHLTRQVYGGNNDVRISIGTTATERGSLRLVPFAGDISGADVQNGEIWYNSTLNQFRKRENGVTSSFGVSTDSVGLIPTNATRPHEWDWSRLYIQAIPSQSNYQHYGLGQALLTMGKVNAVYDANGSWCEHTSAAASGAGAGLQTGHFRYFQAQWLPEIYFRFRLPSDFSSTSATYWLGLFGDGLVGPTGPSHGSFATPTGLAIAAIKYVGSGSVFTAYSCAGSTGTSVNNSTGITLSNNGAYEGMIKFVAGNKVQYWIGAIGGGGMTMIVEHTTNVPTGAAFMGILDAAISNGAAVKHGASRIFVRHI